MFTNPPACRTKQEARLRSFDIKGIVMVQQALSTSPELHFLQSDELEDRSRLTLKLVAEDKAAEAAYLLRRVSEELRAAEAATDHRARHIHLRLAEAYRL